MKYLMHEIAKFIYVLDFSLDERDALAEETTPYHHRSINLDECTGEDLSDLNLRGNKDSDEIE